MIDSLATSSGFTPEAPAGEPASGAMPDSAEHPAQGVVRTLVEVFTVGPYKYTSLAEAVAQARRDRSGA